MAVCSDILSNIAALFFATIWAIGVFGNLIVIIIIFKTKGMRNSMNIFLANLAIADLMVLLFPFAMFEVVSMYPGDAICKARNVINRTMLNASVLFVLAIGFERYYAICQPLKTAHICTKKRAHRISLLSWALGFLLSSGNIFWIAYQNGKCLPTTDFDPAQIGSFLKFSYIIGATFAWFFLPLIVLTKLFVVITQHLKRALVSNVNSTAVMHHRQVFKMLATVITVFFTFQLTFRTLNILRLFNDLEWYGLYGLETILTTLHSAVNPILYNLMSKKFRTNFKKLFFDMWDGFHKWRICLCRRETEITKTAKVDVPIV